VRGWLGMGINDTGTSHGVRPELIQPVNTRLKLADRLREDIRSACGERVALALTPSSVLALTPEGVAAVADYVHQHHLHWCLHMNETGRDNRVALERSGKKLIPYLDDLGVLDEALVAVHCVQVDRRDVRILAERGVNVSHNPVCNMYLGSGISPVLSMLKKKISVSLATDGAGSNNSLDMLETLKLAVLAQRLRAKSGNAFEVEDGLRLAMTGGAKTTGLGDQAGRLAEGCLADITILRANTPKMTPVAEVRQSVVFSSGEENVDTVMVGGKVLLENSHFAAIDEERILARAREAASNLLRRAQIN
jgi:cytosine/adenosine deaminase-related metal-dependent hydrolase